MYGQQAVNRLPTYAGADLPSDGYGIQQRSSTSAFLQIVVILKQVIETDPPDAINGLRLGRGEGNAQFSLSVSKHLQAGEEEARSSAALIHQSQCFAIDSTSIFLDLSSNINEIGNREHYHR